MKIIEILGFSICSSFGRQLCQNCGWAGSELYVQLHITEPPCLILYSDHNVISISGANVVTDNKHQVEKKNKMHFFVNTRNNLYWIFKKLESFGKSNLDSGNIQIPINDRTIKNVDTTGYGKNTYLWIILQEPRENVFCIVFLCSTYSLLWQVV